MRLSYTILGVVICFGSWHHAMAENRAAAQLVNTFENVCLESLPLLIGAVERLKKLEFELTPAGDVGMYELWSEKLGLGGHLHLSQRDRKPSCGFLAENVRRQEVVPLVEAVLANWLGMPPKRVKSDDQYAVRWQVPAGGNMLHIDVSTSLSDDPAKGVSVTLEEGDR